MIKAYYTIAGYKTHYSTDGRKTLCGREVSNGAGETLDMCKACVKSAEKIKDAETVAAIHAEVIESLPAIKAAIKEAGKVVPSMGAAPVEPTCAHRYATVTGSMAQCGATPATGQTLCTYHGGEAAPVEPTPAPVADAHRKCEHRKTLTWDHAQDCPVFTSGAEGRACTCHYSDARCDELDAPAPVEPTTDATDAFESYESHARWAVGPVATREQRDAQIAQIKADAAAGTLSTNPAEWGWSEAELTKIKADAQASADALRATDDLSSDPEFTAALTRLETAVSVPNDLPLTLSLTPAPNGRLTARVGAYERTFADNPTAKMHAAWWAREQHGARPVKGNRFLWKHQGKTLVAPAKF
jgi:hypothetical protein